MSAASMGNNSKPRWKRLLWKLPLYFFGITFLWVLLLRWVPVLYTPLMLQRSLQHLGDKNFKTEKVWRSYRRISPEMARAVIASEDNRFDKHSGFEWNAI